MAKEGYRVYNSGASGERAGSTTAVQLPDVPCELVYIKAVSSNASGVFIGFSGVTVVDGTTDTTSGYELEAGEALGPLPMNNLNQLFMICDVAGDDITYLALRG